MKRRCGIPLIMTVFSDEVLRIVRMSSESGVDPGMPAFSG